MAKWDDTGKGGRNELTFVDAIGGSYTLPINPNAITWRETLISQTHQTFRGRHFQAIKTYKTGGRLVIDTGSDRPQQGIKGGKRLKDELATFIKKWMHNAVYHDAGPLRMIMSSQGIDLKIWLINSPDFGATAQTPHYTITLDFEIAEDIAAPVDLSGMTNQFLPGFTEDVMTNQRMAVNPGDTARSIAYKVWGNMDWSSLIIDANPNAFDSRGSVKSGISWIAIPSLSGYASNDFAIGQSVTPASGMGTTGTGIGAGMSGNVPY